MGGGRHCVEVSGRRKILSGGEGKGACGRGR